MKNNIRSRENINALVGTALLAALVIVLQFFVVIPIGIFYITLTLVPIIIGAILYGWKSGAVLGGVFGVSVAVQVVTGAAGALSTAMLVSRPVITIVLCILKGVAAGLVSGLVFSLFKKKNMLAVIAAAIASPIVNTGIFVGGLFVFYYPMMQEYASAGGFANAVAFIFIGIVGLNFVVEFLINVLLIPVVLRVVRIITNKKAD